MLTELQSLAEALSERLRRAVAFDDPGLRLLVHTAHLGGAVDPVRLDAILNRQTTGTAHEHLMAQGIAHAKGPVRVTGRADLSMLPRLCTPCRHQDELLGYLWLLDDGNLTDEDLELTDITAREAGAVMYRERLLGDLERGRERETLRDLLTEDIAVRRHAATSLSGTPLANGTVVAVVVSAANGADDLESALKRAVRILPPGTCVYLSRVDHGVVLTSMAKRTDDLARSLLAECQTSGPALVGIGDPVEALDEAVTSYTEARRAISVASVVPSLGTIASWSQLGIYGLLVQLGLQELPVKALPLSLQRLFEIDKNGTLTSTLESYLDNASDPAAAVTELRIHRTTLYYRLTRIAELTGMDLKDGGERLAVHLGLKLAHFVGR